MQHKFITYLIMSELKTLSDGVSLRCREELMRLGVKGADFVQKTKLLKSTFSAVSNGVNTAPTGFISALCRHYQADATYIITGVRSAAISNTEASNGHKSKANMGDHSSVQETKVDEREVAYLKEMLKAKDREIADKLSIIAEKERLVAEKERLIQVLMGKTCTPCDTEKENE